MNRAYSILEIKSFNDAERTFEGIASTPAPDRMDDIVEPMGAQFTLPIPLMWQHGKGDIKDPIGWITEAKPTKEGIPVKGKFALPEDGDPPSLVEDLNRAWALVKKKLVRGLSIGFSPIEWAEIKGSFGLRYTKWDWLELSAVAIPANSEASILSVKSADAPFLRASSGDNAGRRQVALTQQPGASGTTTMKGKESMKTIAEQIAAFEVKRAANVGQMDTLMATSSEKGITLSDEDATKYEELKAEVKAIDEHLVRLKEYEAMQVAKATPVTATGVATVPGAQAARSGTILSVTPNVEKGIKMARFVMAQVRANGNLSDALAIAQGNKRWMDQTPEVAIALKAAVAAGDTTTAGWAAELVYNENLSSEFIELLRPKTIIGRIQGLRKVPFNIRVGSQTAGSTGYWVGQAKPIPVSKLTVGATTLGIAKACGLLVIDEELARSSAPSAEGLVRDDLVKANAQFLDVQFVDPNVGAVANVNPASMTNGVTPIPASGTTAAALRADVQSLFNAWILDNVDPTNGVWIMSAVTALSISLMQNALGQPEFPGIGINGGTFFGLPVITSQSANIPGSPASGNMIILMNADDVMLADDGAMVVTVSNQASIEMLDSALQQNGQTGTGASLVSMFQTNSLAIKGVRWINWAKRRSTAVQYIKEAAYVA